MTDIEKRTFSIPSEQAAFINAKVASGRYASASEVIREGLRALQQQEDAVEQWLLGRVATTYDAMKADPDRAIAAERVFAEIRAHHVACTKAD